mmetsp:Transcript_19809/g.35335  ORF Transcript_19809/g.35335 Transcript_19809/m.35335 type:complete len:87 (+) Transcript_19809:779-1039(+)
MLGLPLSTEEVGDISSGSFSSYIIPASALTPRPNTSLPPHRQLHANSTSAANTPLFAGPIPPSLRPRALLTSHNRRRSITLYSPLR